MSGGYRIDREKICVVGFVKRLWKLRKLNGGSLVSGDSQMKASEGLQIAQYCRSYSLTSTSALRTQQTLIFIRKMGRNMYKADPDFHQDDGLKYVLRCYTGNNRHSFSGTNAR